MPGADSHKGAPIVVAILSFANQGKALVWRRWPPASPGTVMSLERSIFRTFLGCYTNQRPRRPEILVVFIERPPASRRNAKCVPVDGAIAKHEPTLLSVPPSRTLACYWS